MKEPTIKSLRHLAARRSFARYTSIVEAIRHLGFVQADPIRAPARAQDLILRHRVDGYRTGDLERYYPSLPISEEALHVYGFLPNEHQRLLHPRKLSRYWQEFVDEHAELRRAVLRLMRKLGTAHPRTVELELGKGAVINVWGGQSSATTKMLEALHHSGLLRVARRQSGQRVYEVVSTPPTARALSAPLRAEGLTQLVTALYAPIPERSLRQILHALRTPANPHPRDGIEPLIHKGHLHRIHIEGQDWIYPEGETWELEADDTVRFLAPFDPVVWDRRRFFLLWNWEYRFEAYTPMAQRKLGYYALPLLWRERVIGWTNVSAPSAAFQVELGFVNARPRDAAFKRALEQEIERMRNFLQSRSADA